MTAIINLVRPSGVAYIARPLFWPSPPYGQTQGVGLCKRPLEPQNKENLTVKNSNIETAIASIQQLGRDLAKQRKTKAEIRPGYMTVSQFVQLTGLALSRGDRILLGKMLNAYARDHGYRVIKRQNAGAVYPVRLLRDAMAGLN